MKTKQKNPIKSLNPLKFLSILRQRNKNFKKASAQNVPEIYPLNELANILHPAKQFVKISDIKENSADCKTFTLSPNSEKGTKNLAYFSAGQYISVNLEIDGKKTNRAYSLCSSPKMSLSTKDGEKNIYQITVKAAKNGLVSNYILKNWKVGQNLEISSPEGSFSYVGLRDAKTVICLAGGSGITPFLSMAKSIFDGTEDFNMILLYGNRDEKSILFKNEFDELQAKCEKLKVIYVLSDEKNPQVFEKNPHYEKGFINSQIIKKFAPKDEKFSIFICGPQAMYNFLDKELENLHLEKKYIRREAFGEIHNAKLFKDYPSCSLNSVQIKVKILNKIETIYGSPNNTILQILESSGIQVPSRCRSGECAWCRSYLKSGKVWVPQDLDFRRKADLVYNYIHPCCTFALSDLEIEISPSEPSE